MAEWEIKKTLGQCFGTGGELEVGGEYYAALVETDEGFERRDFSVDFWNADKPAVYCYWKTKMPEAGRKKKLFIDDEMLMTFFRRLAAETDPEKINFRFVVFDKYDHLYAYPVTSDTMGEWEKQAELVLNAAKYHYDSKDFTLPYDIAVGNVKL